MNSSNEHSSVKFARDSRNNITPSWDKDLLNRKDIAHQLERLIAYSPGPYVIAMTSEWGSGKTFFLKAWENDLRARTLPCVYFNAWESDHAGDPLLALTGCITEELRQKGYLNKDNTTKLEFLATSIAKKTPNLVAKCLIGWGNRLTDGALTEIKEELTNSLEFGTRLFLENEERRKDFSVQLKAIVAAVSSCFEYGKMERKNGYPSFPLVIMIDELDRCRPNYTIELLESIKHLFNVSGIIFILAIDGEQIMSIIEHTFGLKKTETADLRKDYLRKFIDIFWHLPPPDTYNFTLAILIEKKLPIPYDWDIKAVSFDRLTIDPRRVPDFSTAAFYEVLAAIAEDKKKPLRECIQAIEQLSIVSLLYNLTWKEYILIFYMFLSGKSIKSSSDAEKIVGSGSFKKKPHINGTMALDYTGSFPKDLSKALLTHVFNKKYVIEDKKDKLDFDKDIQKAIGQLMNPFDGHELSESISSKISFLKAFGFDLDTPTVLPIGIDIKLSDSHE